jgi:hypothetical protein
MPHRSLVAVAGAAIAAAVAFLAHGGLAQACTPPPNYQRSSVAERVQAADLVFIGTVTATSEPGVRLPTYTATIRVSRWLKGDASGGMHVEVDRYGPGGLCYSEVRIGRDYLFFVDRDTEGRLQAHYTQQMDAVESVAEDTAVRVLMILGQAHEALLPFAWQR